MTRIPRAHFAATLLALSLPASWARAQPVDKQTRAAAEALHDEAVAALDAKDYATACPKLERVVQMVPQGIGARLTLAECFEGAGKLASAWEAYVAVDEAATKAGQKDRQRLASEKAATLRPKLAQLTIVVPDAVRALPGLEIRRGPTVIEPSQWGVPVPVDAGKLVLSVKATGKRSSTKTVDVAQDGLILSVELPLLEDLLPPAPPPPPVALPPDAPPLVPPKPAETGWGVHRTSGVVVGGIGVVTLGVGSYFGLRAISKKSESNADGHCHDGNQCDAIGYALREDGYRAGTTSTVLFVVGGVALAGGVTLLLTAPSAKKDGAQVSMVVGPQAFGLRGAW